MIGTPYSHEAHALLCDQKKAMEVGRRVQVLKRGVVYCAKIISPFSSANFPDCWIVETTTPEVARLVVSCRNTRLCVKCVCVDDDAKQLADAIQMAKDFADFAGITFRSPLERLGSAGAGRGPLGGCPAPGAINFGMQGGAHLPFAPVGNTGNTFEGGADHA